jgi:hypothetical protein
MVGFKYYNWSVTLDDGTRYTYEFQVHEEDSWPVVLRKFGDFLQAEGYGGIKDRIEDLCDEFEEELDNRIDGDLAFRELHG